MTTLPGFSRDSNPNGQLHVLNSLKFCFLLIVPYCFILLNRVQQGFRRTIYFNNGNVKVRTEKSITLEGPNENRRIIMIEFDSIESVKRSYYSDEYKRRVFVKMLQLVK